jgi:hypothetical protein
MTNVLLCQLLLVVMLPRQHQHVWGPLSQLLLVQTPYLAPVICAPGSRRNSGAQTAHGRSTRRNLVHLDLIILQSPVAFNHWCTSPMEKPLYSKLAFRGCLGRLALQVIDHKMGSCMQLPCLMSRTMVYGCLTYLVATWLPISMIHLWQAIIAGRERIRLPAGQTK